MRIKQFYTNHKLLIYGILLVSVIIAVFIFWPYTVDEEIKSTEVFEKELLIKDELKEESTIQILTLSSVSTPTPTLTFIPESDPPRYGFTDEDIYLLAVLLSGSKYVDGDGEFDIDYGRDTEYDQISLVLCVVMNRVHDDNWKNTVSGVIWQKGQFSVMPQWKKGLPEVSDISLKRVTEWCKSYDAYDSYVQSIPEDHFYFSGDGIYNYSR